MAGGACFAFTAETSPGAGTRIASTTIPAQNPPTVDTTKAHIQWVEATVNGAVINQANPLPVSTVYDKILQVVGRSKWMELAVYDEVRFNSNALNTAATGAFYEDQVLIGLAEVTLTSDKDWSFVLSRYIVDDDGTILLDDDDTNLLLE